jgi:hypothetical protein
MTKKEKVVKEIEQVPDIFLDEALDFIRYLKTKAVSEQLGIYAASESSLKKEWLRPEEDAAWENL